MMDKKPTRAGKTPPKTAGTAGARLKAEILSSYQLDPAERVLLDQAAEIADVLTRLNRQVAAEKTLTQRGAKGNTVSHPLLLAQRRHSEVLVKVLEGLRLPAPDEDEGESTVTRLARKAARARWDRAKEVRLGGSMVET